MRWEITWDGARLVVVQRPLRMVWFSAVVLCLTAPGWYALTRGVGIGWSLGGTAFLVAYAVALVWFGLQARGRVEASDQLVRSDRWCGAASQVRIMSVRREVRRYSNQWGRGQESIVTLFVGLVGGRTVDLVRFNGTALAGRAGRDLDAALSALPYGRAPR
jgi:hypothetical protein